MSIDLQPGHCRLLFALLVCFLSGELVTAVQRDALSIQAEEEALCKAEEDRPKSEDVVRCWQDISKAVLDVQTVFNFVSFWPFVAPCDRSFWRIASVAQKNCNSSGRIWTVERWRSQKLPWRPPEMPSGKHHLGGTGWNISKGPENQLCIIKIDPSCIRICMLSFFITFFINSCNQTAQVLKAPTAANELMQAAQLSEAVCDQAQKGSVLVL